MYDSLIIGVSIIVGLLLAASVLSRASARLGEHLAGAFGSSEDYERAYVPWDELMEKMILANPEMYGEADLVLDGFDEEAEV